MRPRYNLRVWEVIKLMSDMGYINYFEILDLEGDCKQGEVRRSYKKLMKHLVNEIGRVKINQERRDMYLLDLARHNAAFYILRDNARRQRYVDDRRRVMELETEWKDAVATGAESREVLRRSYDAALRHFLSAYVEELVLEAGRDSECVEASGWDPAHERHAGRVLRHYRQRLYHEIHERLPFYDVTEPEIDWEERARVVSDLLALEGGG